MLRNAGEDRTRPFLSAAIGQRIVDVPLPSLPAVAADVAAVVGDEPGPR
jgi:hypothetical protein